MVTPLEERAASVVTGKQPILGWRQPLGAAVKSGELRDSITRGPSRSWVRMMRCPLSMSPIEPKIWKAAQAFCLPLSRDRGSTMPVRFAMLNAWRSPRTCR